MHVTHGVLGSGITCIKDDLHDASFSFAFNHAVARIWKNGPEIRLNSEMNFSAAEQCITAFGNVVATVVKQRGAISVSLQRVQTVTHVLESKILADIAIKLGRLKGDSSPHKVFKHNLVIHRTELEVHPVWKNLLPDLRHQLGKS